MCCRPHGAATGSAQKAAASFSPTASCLPSAPCPICATSCAQIGRSPARAAILSTLKRSASSDRHPARRCIAAAPVLNPSNTSNASDMAALSFHPLKVTSVERVADDAACVTVEIPVTLRDVFAHHAGQYVTVRRVVDERDMLRTYFIRTAPRGCALKLGIRFQNGGRGAGD